MADADTNNNNTNKIEHFKLPREDWYDMVGRDKKTGEIIGRIYKDALIENFNAMEEKLKELSQISAFQTSPPDISVIEYPDVTLEEGNDKDIINLRSFLNMTGLTGYPIELTFNDKTCTRCAYWGTDYSYHILTNIELPNVSNSYPYIYLNYVLGSISASASFITPANSLLIGCYSDNKIISVNSFDRMGINLLYYLSRMNIETLDINIVNGKGFRNHSTRTGHNLNGATVGCTDLDTKSGGNFGVARFMRLGRTSK